VIQRAAAAVERSARSQSRMIEDLLDVSRIVTGKLSLDLRWLNLRELIAAVVESVTLQAEAKSIRLEARLEGELFSVSGDSLRLQQVFSNLLTNAIKFTPAGGAVTLALTIEGSDAVLQVSDTGAGIEPAFLPFVFERFSQENASAQRSTGLGLGLSIVRDIVAMHGGKVRAASDGVGKGATFTVNLPLLRVAPAEVALESRNLAPDANLARLNGLRILMVDDDPETLETVGGMLRLNGAKVIVAQSAAEALRAAQESGLEVIISDIAMPGTDGYSLIRSIRALPEAGRRAVPAIALTAAASSNSRSSSLEAGFQEHLEKPIDLDRLALAIAEVAAPGAGEPLINGTVYLAPANGSRPMR
jgi:CheY-like chemotaxis protein